MSGQNDDVRNDAGTCGPGCSCQCGESSIGNGRKWAVCGLVLLAAAGVLAFRFFGAKKESLQAQGYALPAVAVHAASPVDAKAEDSAWGRPLKGISELNVVAAKTEAVFVVIPADDDALTEAIQKEVAAAVSVTAARGTKTGKFLLGKDAEDFKSVVAQTGAPAVIAMVKGKGMQVVADKEVSKDALLKAFVGASRPSGCGAGGCGPSGCK